MNRETFKGHYNRIKAKQQAIVEGRAKHYNTDYQDEFDVLSNFEDVALICSTLGLDISGSDVCFMLTVLKMVRERSEVDEKLTYESTRFDSIIDGMNYQFFYTMFEMSKDFESNSPQERRRQIMESGQCRCMPVGTRELCEQCEKALKWRIDDVVSGARDEIGNLIDDTRGDL